MSDEHTAKALEVLEMELFSSVQEVRSLLSKMPCRLINDLYLMSHTASFMGEASEPTMRALMPIIEEERDCRAAHDPVSWDRAMRVVNAPSQRTEVSDDLPF